MRRPCAAGGLAAALLLIGTPAPAAAQAYRLRLDAELQGVSFRGVREDSVALAETVLQPDGRRESADGFAVSCDPNDWCRFFRPGETISARPLSTRADLRLWGLGVPGLSVHANARVVTELGDEPGWAGTEPAVQLLEGYAEYARRTVTARLGRQLIAGRLGMEGIDGGRVTARWRAASLEADGYLGLGLGRGAVVPVNSPALNPLDEFRPSERQVVAGAAIGWTPGPADLRVEYRREVDRQSDQFAAERLAASAVLRPLPRWSLAGGAIYDLAFGWVGSADASLRYTDARVTALAGYRRYRPHFELWTIWGAFSPVPYNAVHGAVWIRPIRRLELRGRYEWYEFEPAEAETPLADVERDGWRTTIGATFTPTARWTVDGAYRADFGPGAASRGFEARIGWAASEAVDLAIQGATLERPLEFRFSDAEVWLVGGDAEWRPTADLRLGAGLTWYGEERRRPDAANLDWDQVRFYSRVTLLLGSGADRRPLPPGRRRAAGMGATR